MLNPNDESNDIPRILILTLFCGEPQLSSCIKSVRDQKKVQCAQKVYNNLPNKEAHEALFADIMKYSEQYDLYIKLDADMVFNNVNAVYRIYKNYLEYGRPGQISFKVNDHLTGSKIWGVNAYCPGSKWNLPLDGMFLDPSPININRHIRITEDKMLLVEHCPSPSHQQEYQFGIHRAAKVLQFGEKFKFGRSYAHFKILTEAIDHLKTKNVLRGMEDVYTGKIKEVKDKRTLVDEENAKITGSYLIIKILHAMGLFGWILLLLYYRVLYIS